MKSIIQSPLSIKKRNPKLPFIKKRAYNELMKKKTEFKKMHRNIFLSIFLIPFLLTLTIAIATSTSTYILYQNSFKSSFANDVSLLASHFEIGYSQFNAQVLAQSSNDSFIEACEKKNENKIAEDLRNLEVSNSNFLGCLYYGDGFISTSSKISGAPAFNELLQEENFSSFYHSDKTSFSSVRRTGISTAYLTVPYQKDLGMFSIFHKVYSDAHALLGILEVDLSSIDIYRNYLSIPETAEMSDNQIYLCYQDQVLSLPNENSSIDFTKIEKSETPFPYQKQYAMKGDFSSSILESDLKDYSFYLLVPKWNFRKTIFYINMGIVLAVIFFFFVFFHLAKELSDKDCRRLDAIYDEMKNEMKEEA